MKTIWVVVADEAIARILSWPDTGDELQPVEELTDPAAHAKGSDLRNDAYGRRSGNATGGGARRGPSTATSDAGLDEKHLEAEAFAARVAQRLAEALQQRRYDELRIVAAPRFLGLLRKALAKQVAQVVTTELDKDLIHSSNRELSDRLFASPGPQP